MIKGRVFYLTQQGKISFSSVLFINMAGHSKWANIQHRKGRQDARRGKLWTKIIREITVAARAGGADPDANPRLRLAWDKATAANMPKDNIQRAIQRGAGGADGANYEEVRYEGYGRAAPPS